MNKGLFVLSLLLLGGVVIAQMPAIAEYKFEKTRCMGHFADNLWEIADDNDFDWDWDHVDYLFDEMEATWDDMDNCGDMACFNSEYAYFVSLINELRGMWLFAAMEDALHGCCCVTCDPVCYGENMYDLMNDYLEQQELLLECYLGDPD
jgi:hypothetical protein